MRPALTWFEQAATSASQYTRDKAIEWPIVFAGTAGLCVSKVTHLALSCLLPFNTKKDLNDHQVTAIRDYKNTSDFLKELSREELDPEQIPPLKAVLEAVLLEKVFLSNKEKEGFLSNKEKKAFSQLRSVLSNPKKSGVVKGLSKEKLITLVEFNDRFLKLKHKEFLGERADNVFESLKKALKESSESIFLEIFELPVKELEEKFDKEINKVLQRNESNRIKQLARRILSLSAGAFAAYVAYYQIKESGEGFN